MKMVHTEYSQKGVGHYSAGVISGNMLYISGQVSVDPKTGKVPEGIKAETIQALENVELVLTAAGLTRNDVVMCHIYIPFASQWGDVNAAYASFFGEHKPARVVMYIEGLNAGSFHVEIEAMAEIK